MAAPQSALKIADEGREGVGPEEPVAPTEPERLSSRADLGTLERALLSEGKSPRPSDAAYAKILAALGIADR